MLNFDEKQCTILMDALDYYFCFLDNNNITYDPYDYDYLHAVLSCERYRAFEDAEVSDG